MSCGSRWFVVWTKPADEFRAYTELLAQGFETCLPLHLRRGEGREERVVPLFGRYLFCRFDTSAHPWRRIYGTRGVAGLISSSPERPTPVPVGVVESIQERMSARRIVDDPGSAGAMEYFRPGDRVRSRTMPELEGVCRMSAGERVAVLLQMFGRPTVAEFRATELELA